MTEDQTVEELEDIAQDLLLKLELQDEDLLADAYIDMIARKSKKSMDENDNRVCLAAKKPVVSA